MRRPVEFTQYTSANYTQTLDDAELAASVGSSGDCRDKALAESFVDSLKTELISDRVWRGREQVELAIVEYVSWFNHDRLHSSLGDIPPVEFEALHAGAGPNPPKRSPAVPSPGPSGGSQRFVRRRSERRRAETAPRAPRRCRSSPRRCLASLALRARCARRRRAGPNRYPLRST